ncbi:uncharacterized protein LOC117961025 isoform X1 [Etheostoma cragini]|uniref:uncharacterized protein LOC117961025 isoform X1 n=1 Tax=Etheostoma cragini TaxID=417921 RepID=UPI00155F3EF7|nr:uncharacterized protein LOC117961025 isoform X1 [Etheostoma cragini]
MVNIRWIKVFLFLMNMLHLTAANGRLSLSFVVGVGDEFTLPCEHGRHDQDKCNGTYWIFSDSGSTLSLLLVECGKVAENATSDGLSVTENCSLVKKKVTEKDVGRYTCRQLESEDAHVYLSVIHMTEQKDTDEVTLQCSVLTYEWCRHTVEWLYEGKDGDIRYADMQKSHSECSVNLTFLTSPLKLKPKYHELLCEVTDAVTEEVQLFPFSPQSLGVKTGGQIASATTLLPLTIERETNKTEPDTSGTSIIPQGWLRFIIVSVGLAALIITVVVVYIWTRAKGNKTQMDGDAEHRDEDEGTVTYENVGEPSVSVRLH